MESIERFVHLLPNKRLKRIDVLIKSVRLIPIKPLKGTGRLSILLYSHSINKFEHLNEAGGWRVKGESPSAGILPAFAKNPAAVYSADWCRLHMDRLSLLIEIDIKTNATDWRRWSRWRERGGRGKGGEGERFSNGRKPIMCRRRSIPASGRWISDPISADEELIVEEKHRTQFVCF